MDLSGLNQVNTALTNLGNDVFRVGTVMKVQEDDRTRALNLLEFHTQAAKQTQSLLTDLISRPYKATDTSLSNPEAPRVEGLMAEDGDQGQRALDRLNQSFKDRFEAVRSKDPLLAIQMQKVADGQILEAQKKYDLVLGAKKIDHGLAVFQDFEKTQYDLTMASLDPIQRNDNIKSYESGLLDLVNNHMMDEHTASAKRLAFRQKVDFGTAMTMIRGLQAGGTETAESIALKIADPRLFPYLNEESKGILEQHLAVQDQKYKAQKLDQKLTSVNAGLYKQFDGDYNQIISFLSVPDNQAGLGLTLNESSHLIAVNRD
jgi:hypothetical protein